MSARTPFRTTDYALLGVLAQGGPMSGYDARAYIQASISQFWSESFGQIYPALERLRRSRLVRCRTDAESPRSRKVYEITEAGREVLATWLARPPEPERPRSESILKTFLGDQAAPGVAVGHLRDLAESMEHRVAALEQVEVSVRASDAGARSLPYSVASLRAGIHLSRARAAWAREAIDLIQLYEERQP
ncbi:MAG: PadR family transcriptional regulator [Acidobacteria bacterium]|jgi:DNA-binding PadR family transcriptional regulator|nr:PadR family transcriptional regulator [Acidobacteriota bacterium]